LALAAFGAGLATIGLLGLFLFVRLVQNLRTSSSARQGINVR